MRVIAAARVKNEQFACFSTVLAGFIQASQLDWEGVKGAGSISRDFLEPVFVFSQRLLPIDRPWSLLRVVLRPHRVAAPPGLM